MAREGLGEALTGERIGQPLSHESFRFQAPTRLGTWKATREGASLQAPKRLGGVVELGMCGRTLDGNREILALAGRRMPVRIGKVRSRSR